VKGQEAVKKHKIKRKNENMLKKTLPESCRKYVPKFEATPLGLPYRPWMGLKSGRYYQQDVLLYKNSNPATESHGCSLQGRTVRPRKGAGPVLDGWGGVRRRL